MAEKKRKRRKGLQGTLPCIACSHGIPMPLFENVLTKKVPDTSVYNANAMDGDAEICCPECGVPQTMRISVVIRRCVAQ